MSGAVAFLALSGVIAWLGALAFAAWAVFVATIGRQKRVDVVLARRGNHRRLDLPPMPADRQPRTRKNVRWS